MILDSRKEIWDMISMGVAGSSALGTVPQPWAHRCLPGGQGAPVPALNPQALDGQGCPALTGPAPLMLSV